MTELCYNTYVYIYTNIYIYIYIHYITMYTYIYIYTNTMHIMDTQCEELERIGTCRPGQRASLKAGKLWVLDGLFMAFVALAFIGI